MKKFLSFLLILLLLVAGSLLLLKSTLLPSAPENPEAPFSVLFLDVGQGDSALIGCAGHWMLIDGGGRDSSQTIYTVLKKRDITHLDLVIASHPHEDHIGGLSAVFQSCTAGRVLSPTASDPGKSFQNLCRYAGAVTVPEAGDWYSLGGATVEILGLNAGPTENAASIVAKITYGDVSFLFTGDMESKYIDPQWDTAATVLKVSHHGSSNGTDSRLLEQVEPKYAVISLGAKNPYSMPHASVLRLLRQSCKGVFRTDLQGDILFTSDGKNLWISTQREADSLKIFTPGDSDVPVNTLARLQSYLINISSKVFHYPDCPSVLAMKDSNKQDTEQSRDALIAEGFKPCGNCKP